MRLEAEIAASKERVADLKGQLEKVTAALSEAKTLLLERKENKRIVDAAKSTASELAVRLGVDTRWPGEPVLLVGRAGSILLARQTQFIQQTHTHISLGPSSRQTALLYSTPWLLSGYL